MSPAPSPTGPPGTGAGGEGAGYDMLRALEGFSPWPG
jgi:hypothetical protein